MIMYDVMYDEIQNIFIFYKSVQLNHRKSQNIIIRIIYTY